MRCLRTVQCCMTGGPNCRLTGFLQVCDRHLKMPDGLRTACWQSLLTLNFRMIWKRWFRSFLRLTTNCCGLLNRSCSVKYETLPEFCLTADAEVRLTAEGADVEPDMPLLLVTPDVDVLLADATEVPLFLLTVEVVTPIPSLLLMVPLFWRVVSV